ncbi:MAG TPA: HAMP domain-containing sensor histidine kinase [Acidimicrobiia bacterium]|nr:HAMP domain-containing sensor histidine kinase [Acidimicrobiia bacterium]
MEAVRENARRKPLRSLRARLVAGLLALTVVGLAASGAGIYKALSDYLWNRLDAQLSDSRAPVYNELASGQRFGRRLPTGKSVIPGGTFGELRHGPGDGVQYVPRGQSLPDLPEPPEDGEEYSTVDSRAGDLRYRVLATSTGDGTTLYVAFPTTELEQTLRRLVGIELVAASAVLLFLAFLSLAVVRLGLMPLERIAATAGEIAGGDLSRRVEPAESETEIGRLGLALNAMLTQIETAFAARAASEDRLRRFVADASHELRTPLTAIRGYAELFRRGAAERPEDLARAMRRIEEEAARMGLLVEDLLLLARLDQGRPLERGPVDLVAVAGDALADLSAIDPDRPVTFERPDRLVISGDEARLRQVAGNLLTNARIHTPPGTAVHVRVRSSDGQAILEVADEGPGLPPGQENLVFERFYRADAARARTGNSQGTGLGLSIVAAIVAAHSGTVQAGSPPSGRGAYFMVALPVTPPPPPPAPPSGHAHAGPPGDEAMPEAWAPPAAPAP